MKGKKNWWRKKGKKKWYNIPDVVILPFFPSFSIDFRLIRILLFRYFFSIIFICIYTVTHTKYKRKKKQIFSHHPHTSHNFSSFSCSCLTKAWKHRHTWMSIIINIHFPSILFFLWIQTIWVYCYLSPSSLMYVTTRNDEKYHRKIFFLFIELVDISTSRRQREKHLSDKILLFLI